MGVQQGMRLEAGSVSRQEPAAALANSTLRHLFDTCHHGIGPECQSYSIPICIPARSW